MTGRWTGVATAALVVTQSGCASVLSGFKTQQEIQVETSPPGATAVSRERRCETPCRLDLKRKRDAVVELSKPGYEDKAVVFRSRIRPAVAGNLLLGLPGIVIGIPADLISGNGYELVPQRTVVALEPAPDVLLVAHRPAVPAAPAPPMLAPPPPRRLALSFELGAGRSAIGTYSGERDVGVVGVGLLGSVRPIGPLVVGAAIHVGTEPTSIMNVGNSERTLAAVAGVESFPSRGSRVALFAQFGEHHVSRGSESLSLPQAGLRAQASLVAGDRVIAGLWGSAAWDLRTAAFPDIPQERVGGMSIALGLSVGALVF
jgi:hypothetical protein